VDREHHQGRPQDHVLGYLDDVFMHSFLSKLDELGEKLGKPLTPEKEEEASAYLGRSWNQVLDERVRIGVGGNRHFV
jgi:hypothetical protein